MARPREFDDEAVLDALRDVFWEHGYEGASYAQIMKATGLKKGSLYAAFGDKRALYDKALARYDEREVSAGVAMLRGHDQSGRDKIAALFEGVASSAGTRKGRWGCLLCNAATDQAPIDQSAEDAVKASMARLEAAIAAALPPQDGPKAPLILAAYFGARTLVKAGVSSDKIELIGKEIRGLLAD